MSTFVVRDVQPITDADVVELASLARLPDESMLVEGGLIEPRTHDCGREMGVASLVCSIDRMRVWFHCAGCNQTEAILDTIRAH